jgi:CheY-like chemotaxis protein
MTSANILVVDDEPQIRRTLRTTLSFRGYVILEAATGEEALDLVRKQKPDLVLLDVNLPGISGIETCREIRRTFVAMPPQKLPQRSNPKILPWISSSAVSLSPEKRSTSPRRNLKS